MSLPVIFREEAEADMAEAALWYEKRCLGLGAEFVRSVDACLTLISRHQPARDRDSFNSPLATMCNTLAASVW